MRDPHVVSLRYRLVPHETVTFDKPPPVERETDAFRMRLADGIVTFEMKEHHALERDAIRQVEAWLHAWELDLALRYGSHETTFKFEKATVIDRDPPLPGTPQVLKASAALATASALSVTVRLGHRNYPEPPTRFMVSPDVETMWSRYEGYLEGKEPLAAMAYACLTLIQNSAGGQQEAATRYDVSRTILRKLGELTSTIGGPHARKFTKESHRDYVRAEVAWIEAAVRALIHRKGEYDAAPDAQLPQITMGDLPVI